jgi:hypothetical protein
LSAPRAGRAHLCGTMSIVHVTQAKSTPPHICIARQTHPTTCGRPGRLGDESCVMSYRLPCCLPACCCPCCRAVLSGWAWPPARAPSPPAPPRSGRAGRLCGVPAPGWLLCSGRRGAGRRRAPSKGLGAAPPPRPSQAVSTEPQPLLGWRFSPSRATERPSEGGLGKGSLAPDFHKAIVLTLPKRLFCRRPRSPQEGAGPAR